MNAMVHNPIDAVLDKSATTVVEMEAQSTTPETNTNNRSLIASFMFYWFNLAVSAIHRGIVAISVFIFCENIEVILPKFSGCFVFSCLLQFVQVKSQGNKFPFQTHHQAIMISISSLLIYVFVSIVEVVILAAGFGNTSVYAIIARLGRIGSFLIMITSLGSLLYFD